MYVAFFVHTGNWNASQRDYGQPGQRYVALAGTSLYSALADAVQLACVIPTTDEKVQKGIRDGVNTLRLHAKDKRMREERKMKQMAETIRQSNAGDSDNEVEPDKGNADVEPDTE